MIDIWIYYPIDISAVDVYMCFNSPPIPMSMENKTVNGKFVFVCVSVCAVCVGSVNFEFLFT